MNESVERNDMREAWLGQLGRMRDALAEVDIDRHLPDDSSISTEYAFQMVTRLHSSFISISLLLEQGFDDEALMIVRRLLEDGLRLQYLAKNADRADALVAGILLDRDKRVMRRMQSLLEDEDVPEKAKAAIRTALPPRQAAVQKHYDWNSSHGVEPETMPGIDALAKDLNRAQDLVVYASTSDVSHSAISAITASYRIKNDEGIAITLTSNDFYGTLIYTKSAITSVTIGVASALQFIGASGELEAFTAKASRIEAEILAMIDAAAARTD